MGRFLGRGRAQRDRVVEVAGRAGLLSRAAIWLIMGMLAARLAIVGHPEAGAEPGKKGAVQTLARQPFGRYLLALLLVGFIAMVVWAAVEAVRSRDRGGDPDWRHALVAIGRGAVYAGLALTTMPVLFGKQSDGAARHSSPHVCSGGQGAGCSWGPWPSRCWAPPRSTSIAG